MNEALSLLPGVAFVRVHRSYIVAKDKITKIDSNSVWIKNIELPIGTAYAVNLGKILGIK